MLKSFKYQLNPTEKQKVVLSGHFGCVRFIYNWGLNEKSKAFKETGKNLSCFDLINKLPAMKKRDEYSWLSDCYSQSLQMALRNLDNAYTKFFNKKSKFPKFKKKSNHQSIHYPQKVQINNNKVYVPKLGWVHFFKSKELQGKVKTVTISKKPTGRYFISILCETGLERPEKTEVKKETTAGIDLGIKVFAYTSEGQVFENQKHLKKSLKKLRVEQRSLARKKKGSKRREKQRLVVAKIHEKVSFKRNDFLHKTSTELVRNFDTICIEDLNVSDMMSNRRLSRAISDTGWGLFRTMLEYKCEWYGKNLRVIGRFEPSSKMCNHCGDINKCLKLSDRNWICPNCNVAVERDYNAAKNIKDFGLGTRPVAS